MLYSEEKLTHFLCQACDKWFSISDFKWSDAISKTGKTLYCPICGESSCIFDKAKDIIDCNKLSDKIKDVDLQYELINHVNVVFVWLLSQGIIKKGITNDLEWEKLIDKFIEIHK